MNLEESEIPTSSQPENNSYNVLYYGIPTVATLSLLLTIIMVSALVGNFLVISTILKNRLMRTRTNLLLCNLAVADFFTALLDIPVAIHTLNLGAWPYSDAFCAFNGYLVGLGLMLSIHTLMWISIHKFISITRPLSRAMTPGKIFCMIVAAWAWALLYNLGPVLGWTDIVYKRGASQCGPNIPKTSLQISHSATNTIFNFLLPVTVMFYCYYRIFSEVKEHMNRLGEFSDSCVVSTILQQRRITNTLLIVFLCFLVCWSPYIVYSCMLVALGEPNVKPIFNPLAYLATYLNSACNPIIYALRSPSFRKAFQEILFCSPAARRAVVRTTRNVKPAPQAQFVSEDKPKVNLEKDMPTPVSKNERSIGFPERRASLTPSSRNQSVSSASKRLTDSLSNKGSQKWNWQSISYRWSIARSKSASEVAAFKNGQKNRPSIAPNSIPSNEYPFKHRRINTLPAAKMEGRQSSNPTSQTPNTTQLALIKHVESSPRDKSMISCHSPKSPLPQRISNLTNPALKPSGSHLMDEEEASLQPIDSLVSINNPGPFLHSPFSLVASGSLGHENDCPLPKLNDVFNSPRKEKKYSVYFSTFMNRPLSFSAPDLIMTGKFGFIEEPKDNVNAAEEDIENKEMHLKVPQISFLRTCSDGSVQPLLNSNSRPQLYRKEVPQLVWQASLENINIDRIPRLKRTKYGCRRRPQLEDGISSISTRTLGVGRDNRIHNLLNSVECLFSNIFTRDSPRDLDVHPDTRDPEKGSRSVFYTPDKTDEQKTLVPEFLVSDL